ncbi:MAG: isopentenyl-diphosphate Delta-isomerase [Luminiphilus sp.]|jgi:isopentenyl-diphosphate delta-isomerase|nr:isopentenyl-diphosphate Delta-isomerase [Luminiphilus sp.]
MSEVLGQVSFDSEDLILVDASDQVIGNAPKKSVHLPGGQLHRAFSIFVYANHNKVLLHKRSPEKPLWPNFWTNSCCSHPRMGETYQDAVHRRLHEELGIQTPLTRVYQFEYQAHFGSVGTEHELCAVYVGHLEEPIDIRPHPNEISDWGWFDVEEVDRWVAAAAEEFTPWFLMEWRTLREKYTESVASLTSNTSRTPGKL